MNKYYKYLFLIVLPLLGLVILLAQQFSSQPTFNSKKELIDFAEFKQKGKGACQSYVQLLREDSLNSTFIFSFNKAFYEISVRDRKQYNYTLKKTGYSPEISFNNYIKSKNIKIKNTGYYGKAVMSYFEKDYFNAIKNLDSLNNINYSGFYHLKALIEEERKNYKEAFNYYILESKHIEFRTKCYVKLFYYFVDWGDYEKAKKLIHLPQVRKRISSNKERSLYFKSNDYIKYFSVGNQHVLRKIDSSGLVAAFLIMLVWLFYLTKLSLLSNTKKYLILLSTFLSFFTLYPTLLLYDFSEIVLSFDINNHIINDLFYCIFGIGFFEETAKLLPVILVLLFNRRNFKSPMDFILIGSASALGFSFVENLIYFTGNRLDIISLRAFISVVIHMACTSIAVYGVSLFFHNSFNFKNLIKGLSYFLVAITIHGLFDFWLISDPVKHLSYLSIPTMLISIFIWIKILNNSLNNSNAYQNRSKLNIDRLNFLLLTLLSSIICVEFLTYIYKHGADDSYHLLKRTISRAVFYVPYLSFRLSRIDIAPKGTNSIEFVFKNKAFNLDKILNHKAKIIPLKNYGNITTILPSEGIIANRLNIDNDNKWFEFIPSNKIKLNNKKVSSLIIKSKNDNIKLTNQNVIIYVRILFENEKIEDLSQLPFIDYGVLNIN